MDTHEAALTADRRGRRRRGAARPLRRPRPGPGRARGRAAPRPDVVFHLAAYKHVDWAELYPEEFVDTNLQGSWNVLRAAPRGVDTVVVASTDKAAGAAGRLRADEAADGAAHGVLGPRDGRPRGSRCGS